MQFFRCDRFLIANISMALLGNGCNRTTLNEPYKLSPKIGHRQAAKRVFLLLSTKREFNIKNLNNTLYHLFDTKAAAYDIFSGHDPTSHANNNDGMFVTYLISISNYLSRFISKEGGNKLKRKQITCLLIRICYRISELNPPKTFTLYYFDSRKGEQTIDVSGDSSWTRWETCVLSWSASLYYALKTIHNHKLLSIQYKRIYKQLNYIDSLGNKHSERNLELLKQVQGPLWESQKYMHMQKKQALELREQVKTLYYIMLKDLK